jgi:hypothetical protein
MMRVEVAMDKPFRGYIEYYAEQEDTTMPQAYVELLKIGLACSDVDFERPPVQNSEVEAMLNNNIDIEEVLDTDE